MPVLSRLPSGGRGLPVGTGCLAWAEAVRAGHSVLLGSGTWLAHRRERAGKPDTDAYAGTEGEIAPMVARSGGITAATRRGGYTVPSFFMIE